jgi:putative membrane protein
MMHGIGGYGGWYEAIFSMILLGSILWFAFLLINQIRAQKIQSTADVPSALEILKQRYVRGEISRDEFTRIKEQIL